MGWREYLFWSLTHILLLLAFWGTNVTYNCILLKMNTNVDMQCKLQFFFFHIINLRFQNLKFHCHIPRCLMLHKNGKTKYPNRYANHEESHNTWTWNITCTWPASSQDAHIWGFCAIARIRLIHPSWATLRNCKDKQDKPKRYID